MKKSLIWFIIYHHWEKPSNFKIISFLLSEKIQHVYFWIITAWVFQNCFRIIRPVTKIPSVEMQFLLWKKPTLRIKSAPDLASIKVASESTRRAGDKSAARIWVPPRPVVWLLTVRRRGFRACETLIVAQSAAVLSNSQNASHIRPNNLWQKSCLSP